MSVAKEIKDRMKEVIKLFENSLNAIDNEYEKQKEFFENYERHLRRMGRPAPKKITRKMQQLLDAKKYVESIITRYSQLILSVEPTGLTHQVSNFPAVCIGNEHFYIEFSKYILKGIVTNAEADLDISENDIWYALDIKLQDYEKQMRKFIKQDYSVDKENIVEFLELYHDYLSYSYKKGFDIAKKMSALEENAKKHNMEESISTAVIAMGSYLVYKKTGIKDVASRDEFQKELKGRSVVMISSADFQRLIEKYEKNSKVKTNVKLTEPVKETPKISRVKASVKPTGPVKETPKSNSSYIQQRPLTRSELDARMEYVDETTIEEELKNLNISEDLKNEYRAQVRNRRLRIEQELYEMQMRECLNKYLSTEDIQLYESCKGSIDCRSTIEDIDAALELLMTENNEESIALIQSEIEESLEVLRMMNRPSIEEKRIQEPIYYAIYSPIDDLSIPKALESIQQMDKGFYKQAYSQLNKNQFSTNGSREVMGDHLPCRVYETGSNVKVFFAKIGDVDIIIDCLPRNGKEYSSIVKTVTSLEFKIFLDTVSKTMRSGKIIDTSTHRQMIMDELSKSKLVSKSME